MMTTMNKQGWVRKRGNILQTWNKRFFVVDPFAHQLKYYKTEPKNTTVKPRGTFDLNDCKVQEEQEAKGDFRFSLSRSDEHLKRVETYHLSVGTDQERQQWLKVLTLNSSLGRMDSPMTAAATTTTTTASSTFGSPGTDGYQRPSTPTAPMTALMISIPDSPLTGPKSKVGSDVSLGAATDKLLDSIEESEMTSRDRLIGATDAKWKAKQALISKGDNSIAARDDLEEREDGLAEQEEQSTRDQEQLEALIQQCHEKIKFSTSLQTKILAAFDQADSLVEAVANISQELRTICKQKDDEKQQSAQQQQSSSSSSSSHVQPEPESAKFAHSQPSAALWIPGVQQNSSSNQNPPAAEEAQQPASWSPYPNPPSGYTPPKHFSGPGTGMQAMLSSSEADLETKQILSSSYDSSAGASFLLPSPITNLVNNHNDGSNESARPSPPEPDESIEEAMLRLLEDWFPGADRLTGSGTPENPRSMSSEEFSFEDTFTETDSSMAPPMFWRRNSQTAASVVMFLMDAHDTIHAPLLWDCAQLQADQAQIRHDITRIQAQKKTVEEECAELVYITTEINDALHSSEIQPTPATPKRPILFYHETWLEAQEAIEWLACKRRDQVRVLAQLDSALNNRETVKNWASEQNVQSPKKAGNGPQRRRGSSQNLLHAVRFPEIENIGL